MRTPLLTTSEKMANLQPAVIDRRYSKRSKYGSSSNSGEEPQSD